MEKQNRKTSKPSQVSMLFGIASLCSAFFQPLALLSIPAVVFGHIGLSEIKRSQGQLQGKSMAMVGLVAGYFLIIGTAALLTLFATGAIEYR